MRYLLTILVLLSGNLLLTADCRAVGTEVTAQVTVKIVGPAKAAGHLSNAGVVLWLTSATPGDSTLPSSEPAKGHYQLAQRNKEFIPHLLVVPTGSVVEFPNEDPFFHNVFSLFNGRRFDLGLYESGSTRSVHFDRSGVSYIFCNIHPEMSAVIVSVPTHWFAVSSAAGKVVMQDVPPGTYDLHVWAMGSPDAKLAALSHRVSVSGHAVDLGLIAVEESAPRGHKNKFGEDYDDTLPSSY
jgi:plastocyanin